MTDSDKNRVACTRAAGVMLLVCGVPTLAIGLVLLLILQQYGATYIAGIAVLCLAAVLIICGIALTIASCVLKLKKKVGDSYNQNQLNHYNYKMRRASQTTCHTTATMDTVATRLTVAPPSSYYNLPEDYTPPPPPYFGNGQTWEGAHEPQAGHSGAGPGGTFLAITPIREQGREQGQEFGMQRF